MFNVQLPRINTLRWKRLRLVCIFCNAILPSKKEATKDAFIRHLEESHNIVQNADDVLILTCLSDEDKSTLKKKKRASLEDVFGLVIKLDEEDVDDQKKIFNYPRLKKNPKEKYSEFVRRKLSMYFKVQGFGRGGYRIHYSCFLSHCSSYALTRNG